MQRNKIPGKYLLLLLITAFFVCTSKAQKLPADTVKILKIQAPEIFKAKFTTSQGDFVMLVTKAWSPAAADRLFQLINSGYYDNNMIFRATKHYVQFGITDNPKLTRFWSKHPLPDEPVLQSNLDSMVSFASVGANGRSNQIFINLLNHPGLDTSSFNGSKGFTPVAKIIEGMDVLRKFNTQYGDDIMYKNHDSLFLKGSEFLNRKFPGLDKIIKAEIIKE